MHYVIICGRKIFIIDVLDSIGKFYINFYCPIGPTGRRINEFSDQREDKIYFVGLLGRQTNGPSDQ